MQVPDKTSEIAEAYLHRGTCFTVAIMRQMSKMLVVSGGKWIFLQQHTRRKFTVQNQMSNNENVAPEQRTISDHPKLHGFGFRGDFPPPQFLQLVEWVWGISSAALFAESFVVLRQSLVSALGTTIHRLWQGKCQSTVSKFKTIVITHKPTRVSKVPDNLDKPHDLLFWLCKVPGGEVGHCSCWQVFWHFLQLSPMAKKKCFSHWDSLSDSVRLTVEVWVWICAPSCSGCTTGTCRIGSMRTDRRRAAFPRTRRLLPRNRAWQTVPCPATEQTKPVSRRHRGLASTQFTFFSSLWVFCLDATLISYLASLVKKIIPNNSVCVCVCVCVRVYGVCTDSSQSEVTFLTLYVDCRDGRQKKKEIFVWTWSWNRSIPVGSGRWLQSIDHSLWQMRYGGNTSPKMHLFLWLIVHGDSQRTLVSAGAHSTGAFCSIVWWQQSFAALLSETSRPRDAF